MIKSFRLRQREAQGTQRVLINTAELQLMGIDTAGVKASRYRNERSACTIQYNKTRQGYARKRILKPAGYFFVRPQWIRLGRIKDAR